MTTPPLSLTGRALRLLSAREHSRAELERKLAPYEEESGALSKVLDALQAKDFINESRVIESVVHRRSAKLGSARIRHELSAKGLDADAVAQAVQQLRGSELERARAIWQKKFGSRPNSPAEQGKQIRYLASRGFDGDTIRRVIAGCPDLD
ncbi:MAG: recombination regulator RecX [Rhodoferax sp.]|nr:recombination regulator RecX [Rhodoferax sp.]MCF8208925.1 recombination regulator RecX [Rhodoferax sp.]